MGVLWHHWRTRITNY